MATLTLSSNINLELIYMRSKDNPADGPSRSLYAEEVTASPIIRLTEYVRKLKKLFTGSRRTTKDSCGIQKN